ncbi:MAG: FHA domain-containing protein [Acidimicrobiales bacterium]
MDEQLLTVFKLALLGLLYLFFLRVMWAVWTELRTPRLSELARGGPDTSPGPEFQRATMVGPPPGGAPASSKRRGRGRRARSARRTPTGLEITAPVGSAGRTFELTGELTIGRAPGCHVRLDDTFSSNLHARVFHRDGAYFLEDLASTNGTLHNGERVTSTVPLSKGDRITIGSTVVDVR